MFVQNLDKLAIANSYVQTIEDNNNNLTMTAFAVKDIQGNLVIPGFRVYNVLNHGYNTKIFSYDNFLFGTSDVSEDYFQYNIQGDDIGIYNRTIEKYFSVAESNGDIELTLKLGGTPRSNATVKEIALTKNIYTSADTHEVMFYRCVLPEPITLIAETPINIILKITIPSIR